MFHVDLTCEDSRLIASQNTGEIGKESTESNFACCLTDNMTGKQFHFIAEFEQLAGLVFLMLHPNTDSADDSLNINFGKLKTAATDLLLDCPKECWPLP